MNDQNRQKVHDLIDRGVRVLNPDSVDIGEDIVPERISKDRVTIYPGCRLYGVETLILEGATIGFEGPATIVNCQIDREVQLRGGFFRRSVFLEGTTVSSGAQIRECCILEEEARVAHCVGLKQTILFPFVTLGSLINFCDCLMTGGTGRTNHSEIGSSYIHFNFTPNQDKATPSLIGDVPHGVMLDQPPIFLGGQGGLVGPARVGFGTVVAAGTILRGSPPEGGKLLSGGAAHREELPFHPGFYPKIRERVMNNIHYIASLIALRNWYSHVRSLFYSRDPWREELLKCTLHRLDLAVEERVHRLTTFADKLPRSVEIYRKIHKEDVDQRILKQKNELFEWRLRIGDILLEAREKEFTSKQRDSFLAVIDRARRQMNRGYIDVVKSLPSNRTAGGTRWLQGIIDEITDDVLQFIPAFQE